LKWSPGRGPDKCRWAGYASGKTETFTSREYARFGEESYPATRAQEANFRAGRSPSKSSMGKYVGGPIGADRLVGYEGENWLLRPFGMAGWTCPQGMLTKRRKTAFPERKAIWLGNAAQGVIAKKPSLSQPSRSKRRACLWSRSGPWSRTFATPTHPRGRHWSRGGYAFDDGLRLWAADFPAAWRRSCWLMGKPVRQRWQCCSGKCGVT